MTGPFESTFEQSRDQAALAVDSTKGNLLFTLSAKPHTFNKFEVLTKRDLRRLPGGHKSDFGSRMRFLGRCRLIKRIRDAG